MNIRDIIEEATFGKEAAGRWVLVADDLDYDMVKTSDGYNVVNDGAGVEITTFIATFDPEHVALMEAVIEAEITLKSFKSMRQLNVIDDAIDAIATYRKEHSL